MSSLTKIYAFISVFKILIIPVIFISIFFGNIKIIRSFHNEAIDTYGLNYKNSIDKYHPEEEYIIHSGGTIEKKHTSNKENLGIIKSMNLLIPNIGIDEPIYVMKIGDVTESINTKYDKDLINGELWNLQSIGDGFLISAHSSGYWWDKSYRKEIFKDLYKLNSGDKVYIKVTYTSGVRDYIYTVEKTLIGKNLKVHSGDSIIFTCHPYATSEERLAVFLKKENTP